jgi:hypothetical protein
MGEASSGLERSPGITRHGRLARRAACIECRRHSAMSKASSGLERSDRMEESSSSFQPSAIGIRLIGLGASRNVPWPEKRR